jgi:hypothetical protein
MIFWTSITNNSNLTEQHVFSLIFLISIEKSNYLWAGKLWWHFYGTKNNFPFNVSIIRLLIFLFSFTFLIMMNQFHKSTNYQLTDDSVSWNKSFENCWWKLWGKGILKCLMITNLKFIFCNKKAKNRIMKLVYTSFEAFLTFIG